MNLYKGSKYDGNVMTGRNGCKRSVGVKLGRCVTVVGRGVSGESTKSTKLRR